MDIGKKYELIRQEALWGLAFLNIGLWNMGTLFARDYAKRHVPFQTDYPGGDALYLSQYAIPLVAVLAAIIVFFVFDFRRLRRGKLLPYQRQPAQGDREGWERAYMVAVVVMGCLGAFIAAIGPPLVGTGTPLILVHIGIVVSWTMLVYTVLVHHFVWRHKILGE